jgi:hypothetical protein
MTLRTKIAEDLVKMRKAGIMPDISYDVEFTEDDLPAAAAPITDYSDPIHLATDGLTIRKIQDVLSPAERLWAYRMIEAHGEEAFLKMWPSYEVQLNFERSL